MTTAWRTPAPVTTREAILERYHTLRRREAGFEAKARSVLFKSFQRTLGPWLPADKNSAILDIGCGEGALLAFLRDAGFTNLHGFDASPENVQLCHARGFPNVAQHDALELRRFAGGRKFNFIFCLDLLEHLPKEAALGFIASLRERLDYRGYAVLQTPNMGCVFGLFHRYADLTHEHSLTETTALDLLMAAGFPQSHIEVRPAWNATTLLGHLREAYLSLLHKTIWLAEDSLRPRIPTKNLLIRGFK
jgi:2-polyprenyl-3-methyl-5-hydroxy-6-metoxy-1,4-benzoquinol methylase